MALKRFPQYCKSLSNDFTAHLAGSLGGLANGNKKVTRGSARFASAKPCALHLSWAPPLVPSRFPEVGEPHAGTVAHTPLKKEEEEEEEEGEEEEEEEGGVGAGGSAV
jgi:hypothetical protein